MKRKESEWGFEDLLEDRPDGTEIKPIELDADSIMVHVACPRDYTESELDDVVKWGKRLQKKLPENAFLLVTTEDMKLNVHRPPIPKKIHIEVRDTIIKGSRSVWQELMDKVAEFDQAQDLVYMQIDMNGCVLEFNENDEEEILPISTSMLGATKEKKEDPLLQKWEEQIAKGSVPALTSLGAEKEPCSHCGSFPFTSKCPSTCEDPPGQLRRR